MTVIAWDGRTLAADKLACNGNTRSTTTKIFSIDGVLVGVTGDLSIGMEMVDWYKDGAKQGKFPASNRDPSKGCSLVIIRKDSTVWKYESSPFPFQVEGKFAAFGCGDVGALVAMSTGCDSKRAVELVSQFDNGCGNGVDTLSLSPLVS